MGCQSSSLQMIPRISLHMARLAMDFPEICYNAHETVLYYIILNSKINELGKRTKTWLTHKIQPMINERLVVYSS